MSSDTSPTDDRRQQRADLIARCRRMNEEVKAFRAEFPDSPMQAVAFQIAALAGQIEARLLSEENTI